MLDPWIKFYPQDWIGDEQLRLCSLAARGLWAAFLFPMHKADPYGHLLLNGRRPEYVDLARLVGCTVREVKYGIEELIKNGVCSVREDGTLYSRRMIRDAEKLARKRSNGRLGGNPKLLQGSYPEVNHQDKQVDKAIDARSQMLEIQKERVTAPPTMAGALPRDFRNVTWISARGKNVPNFLHQEFIKAVGGDERSAHQRLMAFYEAVELGWPDGPIGDEPIKLWRQEFAAKFPRVAPVKAATVNLERLTPFEMARRAGLK